jgi:acyl-ACP thioesterase
MSFGSAARTFEMVEPTGAGRSFTARRRVRLGDATPNGRLRLDAVANDDGRDADWSDPHWWVVRRTVIDVRTFPVYLQEVDLTTWCGGTGSHWAERRTRIASVDGEVLVDAAALWVHVDEETLQPSRVPDDIIGVLMKSADDRSVGARLLLKPNEFDSSAATPSTWPLRFSDFDAVGHMNNAAYWEVLEEHMVTDMAARNDVRAVVEHVIQVEPGQSLSRSTLVSDGVAIRMSVGEAIHATAWLGQLSD